MSVPKEKAFSQTADLDKVVDLPLVKNVGFEDDSSAIRVILVSGFGSHGVNSGQKALQIRQLLQ